MSEADLGQLRIERGAARPARRRFRIAYLVPIALIALAGGYAYYRSVLAPIPVETASVTSAYPYQALVVLNAAGYVVAQRKASVATKATGRLEWLGVAEGSRVKRDEVIARLENRDVRAAAEQAQAQTGVARAGIGQAEAEVRDALAALQRTRDLVAKRFVAQASLDAAQARHDKARAALQSARAQLAAAQANARAAQVAVEQTLIRAPFDGVVLTKNANVGDIVTPFSSALESKGAVVTMADMDTLEVEADVSESNLEKIRPGQACEIQLDAFPELRLRGVVSRLVPTVDRAKATVMAKVRFLDPDPRVLPEMSAKVAFLSAPAAPEQRKPVAVVSPQAVASRGGQSRVFRVEDGRAREVAVRTGGKLGEAIVVDGLKVGDRVVVRPPERLKDGSRVQPLQK